MVARRPANRVRGLPDLGVRRPLAYHPVMPGVWNIAHRGASADRPENTLAAFEEAIRQGADVIEADVRPSADGELLVINDALLDRTTNATGAVSGTDYARARSLDAGRGERIPTPDEVLELARGRARVTFDIKDDAAVEGLIAIVDELEMADHVTFSTFGPEIAERLHELGVASPIMQVVDSAAGLASLAVGHGGAGQAISGIGIPAGLVSAELTDRLQRHGFGVFAGTVDDPRQMERLVRDGVNGILTNRPGVLAGVLRAHDAGRA
jgi:glycerophosphoryl diester phosphodiesterase